MKTLILRTIAHNRVWESPNERCYYETSQLNEMILNWQPDYLELKVTDINFALGIYAWQYFKPSYGKIPSSGTEGEECISLIKPTGIQGADEFQRISGVEDNSPFTSLSFNVIGKLWNGGDSSMMAQIDLELIEAKKAELKNDSQPTISAYNYPLSFVLETQTVFSILSKYSFK
jgi:hypothetical protein